MVCFILVLIYFVYLEGLLRGDFCLGESFLILFILVVFLFWLFWNVCLIDRIKV